MLGDKVFGAEHLCSETSDIASSSAVSRGHSKLPPNLELFECLRSSYAQGHFEDLPFNGRITQEKGAESPF